MVVSVCTNDDVFFDSVRKNEFDIRIDSYCKRLKELQENVQETQERVDGKSDQDEDAKKQLKEAKAILKAFQMDKGKSSTERRIRSCGLPPIRHIVQVPSIRRRYAAYVRMRVNR